MEILEKLAEIINTATEEEKKDASDESIKPTVEKL